MSDPFDSRQGGWSRYYVKSSPLLQRDLSIFDDESFADNPKFAVVGKKRVAEILNASGSVVMTALTKGVTLSRFEYTNADGTWPLRASHFANGATLVVDAQLQRGLRV